MKGFTNSDLLKSIRVLRGKGQKDIAAITPLNKSRYCEKENDLIEFRQGEMINIAKFLNLTQKQFMDIFFGQLVEIEETK